MFEKEITEPVFEVNKNNNAVDFFSPFFNVVENDNNYELETWTGGGVNMFITVSKKNWKDDFQKYVDCFDVDEEIRTMLEVEIYQSASTYSLHVEDFEKYQKWLVYISKLLKGKSIEEVAEKPIENISVPFNTFVLTFNKKYFEKSNLEVLSDVEKYNIAKDNDKKCCYVYTASEYTNKLNSFIPMDRFVFTYIVNIPV